MKKVNSHLKQKLKNSYFKELYGLEQQKLEIANILIDYRTQHKLSQKALAKKIGVTQQYISKVENGKFSSFKTLVIILLLVGFKIKFDVKKLPKQFPITPEMRARLKKELSAA